jgi:hypothetical protein
VMGLLVGVQVRFLVEPFIARGVGAAEWLFSGMNSQMSFEVKVEAELLAADLTLVGLLPCVHKHVSFQFGVVQKPLIATIKSALELITFKLSN